MLLTVAFFENSIRITAMIGTGLIATATAKPRICPMAAPKAQPPTLAGGAGASTAGVEPGVGVSSDESSLTNTKIKMPITTTTSTPTMIPIADPFEDPPVVVGDVDGGAGIDTWVPGTGGI